MRLYFTGWGRDGGVGWNSKDKDFVSVVPTEEQPRTFSKSKIYLSKAQDEEIVISFCAERVRLNGNYLLQLRLGEKEIAHLAAFMFKDKKFSDAIVTLSLGGKDIKIENKSGGKLENKTSKPWSLPRWKE